MRKAQLEGDDKRAKIAPLFLLCCWTCEFKLLCKEQPRKNSKFVTHSFNNAANSRLLVKNCKLTTQLLTVPQIQAGWEGMAAITEPEENKPGLFGFLPKLLLE